MDRYKPRSLRPWSVTTLVLRLLAYLLRHWVVIVIAVLLISPIGPHLRIQYSYVPLPGGGKSMTDCLYIGTSGWVTKTFGDDCPFIALIDTRDVR
ncbi:MAG: hypothetical protein Kilf2KO_37710 [Rhodospirillales bacterium]